MTTTMARTPSTYASAAVARRLLHAITSRYDAGLQDLCIDDVWPRARLVRETIEAHDTAAEAAVFRGWFGGAVALQALCAHPFGPRS